MVQFKIVSGKMAGTEMVARRFPFLIGRSPENDLQLQDGGVWDRHLELSFEVAGFILRTQPNAIASINGAPFQEAILRNGDSIEIGGLKLRFWLAETGQFNLAIREWLTWGVFGLIVALQLYLIYNLVP